MRLPHPGLALDQRTAYRFAVLSAMSTRSVAHVYKRYGLTVGGWRTLSLIGHHEPTYPSEIATRTSVEPDKVTRAVDRLVAQRYVARAVDGADRRRAVLTLTRRGRAVYAAIEGVRRAGERQFLAALTLAERRRFFALLAKLKSQARRLFTDARPR